MGWIQKAYNTVREHVTPSMLSMTSGLWTATGVTYLILGWKTSAEAYFRISVIPATPVAAWGVLSISKYLSNVICVKKEEDGLEEDGLEEEDAQDSTKMNLSNYIFSDECEKDLIWTVLWGVYGTLGIVLSNEALSEKAEGTVEAIVFKTVVRIISFSSLLIATTPAVLRLSECLGRETPVELVGEIEIETTGDHHPHIE